MKDITPEGSTVVIYLDPTPTEQQEKDVIERAKLKADADAEAEAKATAERKLAALGLTTDDLRALGL
jgi:hypothetical protein